MDKLPYPFSLNFWQSLLYSGIKGADQPDRDKIFVANIYILLAFLSLTIFGSIHIVRDDGLLGQAELIGGGALAIIFLVLRLTHKVVWAITGLLLTVLAMLFVLLVTGGTNRTGLLWFFMFPVMAFFLAGKKQGVLWIACLYATIALGLVLEMLSIVQIPYTSTAILHLTITIGIVSVGIFVYEGALEKARFDTLDIDRAKGEFVALASHQLRTPISAISWFAEMLLNGDAGKLTDEQHSDVKQIYDSNRRMTAIINDMLVISNLSLGSQTIKPVRTDISTLAHDILKDLKQGVLAGRNLSIEEQFQPDLPKVAVDMEAMRMIIHNLLSNAVKYTPDGGTVILKVRRSREKLSRSSKGSLVIVVTDTGYGMPPEVRDRIFTKFFRGHNIQGKDVDGTGLGLFMIKSLLDYVGGGIEFVSEENIGSTFTVKLPLEGMPKITAREVYSDV